VQINSIVLSIPKRFNINTKNASLPLNPEGVEYHFIKQSCIYNPEGVEHK
jgi:hypothetical protein